MELLIRRLLRVVRLDTSVFDEVRMDPTATGPPFLVAAAGALPARPARAAWGGAGGPTRPSSKTVVSSRANREILLIMTSKSMMPPFCRAAFASLLADQPLGTRLRAFYHARRVTALDGPKAIVWRGGRRGEGTAPA